MKIAPIPDRWVQAREAQHLLGIGSTTLYKFRRQGKLHPVKFSSRGVRYRLSEIQALIADADSKEGQ